MQRRKERESEEEMKQNEKEDLKGRRGGKSYIQYIFKHIYVEGVVLCRGFLG